MTRPSIRIDRSGAPIALVAIAILVACLLGLSVAADAPLSLGPAPAPGGGTAAAASNSGTGDAAAAIREATPDPAAPVDTRTLAETYGVDFVRATLTARGEALELRYLVTDHDKADCLLPGNPEAFVVDDVSGAAMTLTRSNGPGPHTARRGRSDLRNLRKNGAFPPDPRAVNPDGSYFVLLPNALDGIEKGGKVHVRIGELWSGALVVE